VAVARVASSVLFSVTPSDPATLVATSVFLGLVSVAACCVPGGARRVDPIVALRHE
jgi:hypothetical protein